MRMFTLLRNEDETGVSGTGTVAEGVQFSDGRVALRWTVGDHQSMTMFDDIEGVEAIHGHNGKTQIVWADDKRSEEPSELDLRMAALTARARGDGNAERRALDGLAFLERRAAVLGAVR